MKTSSELVPFYPHNPVIDLESLALLLNTSLVNQQDIAESASRSYRSVPQKKKDGSLRMTYDAYPALKRVQHQIVKKILRRAQFPRYLHGGIRDSEFPRDHVSNAALHTGASILILDDIKDFYPSLDSQLVFAIWLRFFGFSPEVSELLTKLTTRKGVVPQGARTSSYLANLAFWDKEPLLVADLQIIGLTYSRFVDDITYSARSKLSNQTIASARAKVYGMLASKGCRPKRSKSYVGRKGQKLAVTGLITNAATPAIDKAERKRIRSAVHNLERAIRKDGMTPHNRKAWDSARGRVGRLVRIQHPEAQQLSQRLEAIRPD